MIERTIERAVSRAETAIANLGKWIDENPWRARRVIGGLIVLALLVSAPAFAPVFECYRARMWVEHPGLLWTTVGADAAIFVAYMWIPKEALRLREQLDVPVGAAFVGTAAFVISCGLDHLDDVITTFYPIYLWSAEKRVITAVISLGFATAVRYRLRPQIVAYVEKARADRAALAESASAANARATEAEQTAAKILALGEENERKTKELQLSNESLIAQRQATLAAIATQDATVEQLRDAFGEQERLNQKLKEINARLETANAELERLRDEAVRKTVDETGRADNLARLLLEKEELNRRLMATQLALREQEVVIRVAWDEPKILLAPIQGTLDTTRIKNIQEAALDGAAKHQARWVLIDLAEVSAADTAVVQCALQLERALRLIGAKCVFTGLRPEVARTMAVFLDASGIAPPENTLGSIAAGLRLALGMPNTAPAMKVSRR